LGLSPLHTKGEGIREFVDDAGRIVHVPNRITRVFAAGPPAAILLYTLAPETLLGWNRALQPDEAEFIAPPYRDLPVVGRLTGRANTTHVEDVLGAGADLILDYGSVTDTYKSLADRAQEQTRLPYVLIDGAFDKIPDAYRVLGDLLNRRNRAERLAQYAERLQEQAKAVVHRLPSSQRPKVYYGRGPDGLETAGNKSINVELLVVTGAKNVVRDTSTSGLLRVSMEDVLRWNPDVIITLDEIFFKSVFTDNLWQNVNAVVKKKVFLAPRSPFGWFDRPPSVNRLIGVPWLLSILYPHLVSDTLEAEVFSFYRNFYHVDLSRSQIRFLLDANRLR
jgi:iron complex transport system substrate-binding protein